MPITQSIIDTYYSNEFNSVLNIKEIIMAKSLKETMLKEIKKSRVYSFDDSYLKHIDDNLKLMSDRTLLLCKNIDITSVDRNGYYDGSFDLSKMHYIRVWTGDKRPTPILALPISCTENMSVINFFGMVDNRKNIWGFLGTFRGKYDHWYYERPMRSQTDEMDKLARISLDTYLHFLRGQQSSHNVVKFEAYTGPYKFIKGTLNCDQISDAKLIKYTFENTAKPFEQIMVEEIPFSNFLLELNVADGSTTRPTYLHYLNGFLRVLAVAKEEGMFVNMADIDLNNWKVGVSLTINPTDVNIYPDLFKSDDEWIKKFTASLNYWIGGFTEFMYKFNRLMPYIEQPASVQKEIHVAQVVNNISVYKIVQLGDVRKTSTQGRSGGAHASPREHTRIGHKRVYKRTGKEIWIDETTVNEGVKAKIHKEYRM